MNKTCYNCNTDISKESTKEHIPARNLFDGFSERQTDNITVLSCYKCNNDYSKIDEKFMHFIGFITSNNDNKILHQKVTEKYFKTFESKVEFLNNTYINSPISESELIKYHKKNFKGLMMNDFRIYISNNDKILIDIYELTKKKYPDLFNSLNSIFNWKQSGHEKVFRYKILTFKSDDNLEELFFCIMEYNKSHHCTVAYLKK